MRNESTEVQDLQVVQEIGFDPSAWPMPTSKSLNDQNILKTPRIMLTIILAIASMLVGLLCSFVMIVMFFAGGANASPTAIGQIKWLIASVVFVQGLSLVSSIVLLIAERGTFACGAGLASSSLPRKHESSDDPTLHFDRIEPPHGSAHFSQLPKSEPKNRQRNQAEEQTEEDVLSSEAALDDDDAGVGGIVPARNGFTRNPFVKFRLPKDLTAYVDRRSGDKAG